MDKMSESNMIGMEHMEALFRPKGVAVVGATERPGSVCKTLLENLMHTYSKSLADLPFQIFPVDPTRAVSHGLKCYSKVSEINADNSDNNGQGTTNAPCDHVVLVVAAHKCLAVVEDCCLNKNVKVIVVIAAGFKETGEEGLRMEQELVSCAARHGVAVVGPNCLGVQCPPHSLNATFAADGARKGHVAFVSQSGAMCTAMLDWSLSAGLGFSAFVSIGSMSHVDWSHCIEYLGKDEQTKAIVIYMETIGNARSFMTAARKVAQLKPIIVIKAGKSEAAAAAAISHTGSLAGSYDNFVAAMRCAGCLVVKTIDEIQHLALLCSMQPKASGNKVYVVTNAGGPGVLCADAIDEAGLDIAALSDPMVEAMNAFLPAAWSHNNPIDVIGDAKADVYGRSVEVVLREAPAGASLIVCLSPQSVTEPLKTAEEVVRVVTEFRKSSASGAGASTGDAPSGFDGPVVCSWMGGAQVEEARAYLMSHGIPCFNQPDQAATTLGLLFKQVEATRAMGSVARFETKNARTEALQILNGAAKEKRNILTEFESKEILRAYNIPVARSIVCASAEEAAVAAENETKFPCVVKLNSETITHKSDVGGVKLNIKSRAEVMAAFNEIKKNVEANVGAEHFQGVTVQPMLDIASGVECLVGSSSDLQFGPMVLFGTGGCMVEVFGDAATAVPPLGEMEAQKLVDSTKISKALRPGHGERFKGCPLDEMYGILQKFSYLICDLYEVVGECEINPLLALKDRVIALDARIVLRDSEDTTAPASPCLL